MLTIRYVSKNPDKIAEVSSLLEQQNIKIIGISAKIQELQTANLKDLIHDKAIKAFAKVGRPLIVEHTGLFLPEFGNLPGGLTQPFWDQLKANNFSAWFGRLPTSKAIAKSTIGYTDGKQVHYFIGKISGRISPKPRGDKKFGWDCVFIPDGYDLTFAELGDGKHRASMRHQALTKFARFLKKKHLTNTSPPADINHLRQQITNKKVILFVGAGVSMNCGLPSFKTLIDQLATGLKFDPSLFHLFGDYLSLTEFYALQKNGLSELPKCLQQASKTTTNTPETSEIYQQLVALDFPIIYTTNYDDFLERAYGHHNKPFHKISHIADLADSEPGKTQIIKFHGNFTNHNNDLVLTESSYFKRMNFEAPLDIRLRSDIIGKSVLFIGYSLSDINIRYLLYQMHQLWQSHNALNDKPKSYIFLTKPNLIQETLLNHRGIIPIVSENDHPGEALLTFLQQLG